MNLQHELNEVNPRVEEFLRLRKLWIWFVILGSVLLAVGATAIGAALIVTLTSVVVFGGLLLGGGVVQLVNAFLARTWKGFALHLFAGLISLVVGGLMVDHPVEAAEGLTLMLAAAFLLGGAVRVTYALSHSFVGQGWALLNGFISILLGISIWRQYPEASLWVIGLFIGIDLGFNGWLWVMLGLTVKAGVPAPEHTAAHEPPLDQPGLTVPAMTEVAS
jgi:uncharacterized membrane protein HdeD (DUF308 family)